MSRAHTFTVAGDGEFPFSMMEHDECLPVSERDVQLMELDVGTRDTRAVQMFGYRQPSHQKWERFGWKVVMQDGEIQPLH